MAEVREFFNEKVPVNHAGSTPEPAAATTETKASTPETVAETQQSERARGADGKFAKAPEGTTEAEPGTARTQEPEASTVEEERPLPPGAEKRRARLYAEQAQIDAELAAEVAKRDAKRAELAKLKADTGKSGSEPAPNTAPAKTEGKPAKPSWEGEEKDPGALKYWAAHREYEEKNEAWIVAEATRVATEQTEARIRAREHGARVAAKIAEGEAKHGKGFDAMRQQIIEGTPEGLQIEIGINDGWPDTVAHLAQNPEEMAALSALYASNPSMAIRELGRLEDRLKKPVTKEPPVAATKPLPEPPARAGGGATASPKIDMEKAPMSVFKNHPIFKR